MSDIKKEANVKWSGDLKTGKGTITTQSHALKDIPYGFNTRFTGDNGTNPEELIAAAHASCFTMAMAKELTDLDYTINQLDTNATVTLKEADSGFHIPEIHLSLFARVDDIDNENLSEIARNVKKSCPVSKLFNSEITLNIEKA